MAKYRLGRNVLVLTLLVPAALFAVDEPEAAASADASAVLIDIDNPPEGRFSDEWYVLMLDGRKSGHMHTTMERVRLGGQDVILSTTSMNIEVGRADTKVGLRFTQTSQETVAGEPLGFKHRMQLGRMPSVTTGRIADGKVTINSTQFGIKTGTKTYDLPEGAIMTWGTYREQIERGLHPGLEYELSVYEPTMSPDKLTKTTMEVFEPELLDLFGRKVRAYRTRQTAHLEGGLLTAGADIETTSWMSDAGTVVKMQMTVPPIDIPFEIIACPKSVALAPNDPAELMIDTLVRAGGPVDADNATRITYRLLARGGKELVLPETAMQRIVETRDGTVTVELTRRSGRTGGPDDGKAKPEPDDLEAFLEPTADLNFKDPVVAKLASEAAGGEKDPNKLAERLTRFVHEYVQTKNLSIGFATASEVARSREGDCTEHGVLLAALGRAAGIPSRVVTGIVYTDRFAGQRHVFVGHLWTQFWLDGEWVDLDAALNQTDVDPTHIALGLSAGDSGLADLVASGWMSLDKLGLKVLATE